MANPIVKTGHLDTYFAKRGGNKETAPVVMRINYTITTDVIKRKCTVSAYLSVVNPSSKSFSFTKNDYSDSPSGSIKISVYDPVKKSFSYRISSIVAGSEIDMRESPYLLPAASHTYAINASTGGGFSPDISAEIYMGDYYSKTTRSITVDNIPIASTMWVRYWQIVQTDTADIGHPMYVDITRKGNTTISGVTHKITYKVGNKSGTLTSSTSASSYQWSDPSDLGYGIPTSTTGIVRITVTTYYEGSSIGSTYMDIKIKIPDDWIPSASITSVKEANTDVTAQGSNFPYVQTISKLRIKTIASGITGSTISSKSVKFNSITYTKDIEDFETYPISSSGTLTITLSVTDSRGRKNTATKTVTVEAYSPPYVTINSCYRANNSTSSYPRDDKNGKYIRINLKEYFSTLGDKNNATVTIAIKPVSGDEDWTQRSSDNYTTSGSSRTRAFGTFDLYRQWNVRVTITDLFQSSEFYATIPTVYITMEFGSDGSSISFGKACENDNTADFGIPAKFSDGFDYSVFPWITVNSYASPAYTDPTTVIRPVQYRKIGNHVFVRGTVGITADFARNAVVFNLPTGYRPTQSHYFPVSVTGNAIGKLAVVGSEASSGKGNVRFYNIVDLATGTEKTGTEFAWVALDCDFFID